MTMKLKVENIDFMSKFLCWYNKISLQVSNKFDPEQVQQIIIFLRL